MVNNSFMEDQLREGRSAWGPSWGHSLSPSLRMEQGQFQPSSPQSCDLSPWALPPGGQALMSHKGLRADWKMSVLPQVP